MHKEHILELWMKLCFEIFVFEKDWKRREDLVSMTLAIICRFYTKHTLNKSLRHSLLQLANRDFKYFNNLFGCVCYTRNSSKLVWKYILDFLVVLLSVLGTSLSLRDFYMLTFIYVAILGNIFGKYICTIRLS